MSDGVEEVFSAAGESVSLSCSHASSPGVSVMWAVGGKPQSLISPDETVSGAFRVTQDSSLAINQVSALHGGEYQCSESSGQKKVLNKVRLHVLEGESKACFHCVNTGPNI